MGDGDDEEEEDLISPTKGLFGSIVFKPGFARQTCFHHVLSISRIGDGALMVAVATGGSTLRRWQHALCGSSILPCPALFVFLGSAAHDLGELNRGGDYRARVRVRVSTV